MSVGIAAPVILGLFLSPSARRICATEGVLGSFGMRVRSRSPGACGARGRYTSGMNICSSGSTATASLNTSRTRPGSGHALYACFAQKLPASHQNLPEREVILPRRRARRRVAPALRSTPRTAHARGGAPPRHVAHRGVLCLAARSGTSIELANGVLSTSRRRVGRGGAGLSARFEDVYITCSMCPFLAQRGDDRIFRTPRSIKSHRM